jgi:hypothetical protein
MNALSSTQLAAVTGGDLPLHRDNGDLEALLAALGEYTANLAARQLLNGLAD